MELNQIKLNASTGELMYLDSKYLYIAPGKLLKISKDFDYKAIIVEGRNIDFVHMIVKRIRGDRNPQVYLKPIILMNGESHQDPFILSLTDGVIFSLDQVSLIHENVATINERIEELLLINSVSFDAMVISKLLYFMHSRGKSKIEPIPYVGSKINYSYSFLACNFKEFEERKVLEILNIAMQEGVLKENYVDRIYLCSNCETGHLNYREACPKCGSTHTETHDIIHHFPCAYVGQITDFTNEIDDQLHCPKCSKKLKHIGVDYDKPSVLHVCLKCDNRFQDYKVMAKCMNCKHDNFVENLISESIFEYQLTKKGENFAMQGYVSTSKDIEEVIGTVKFDTFRTVVRYEVERIRQTEGNSNIATISIINSGELYAKVGKEAQRNLLKDLVGEIRSSIRTSDMITFYSSSVILVTLFDLPQKVAINLLNDIVQLLEKLVENNFKSLKVEFESKVKKLEIKTLSENQINELIKM